MKRTSLASLIVCLVAVSAWLGSVRPSPTIQQPNEEGTVLPDERLERHAQLSSSAEDSGTTAPSLSQPMVPDLDVQHGMVGDEDVIPPTEPAVGLPPSTSDRAGSAEPADNPCERPAPPPPLPVPGSAGAADFWQTFRTPLPPTPVYDPPGPKRVGLQAGHWRVEEAPPELGRLGHGASGGGRAEWEVNLELARRAAELLRAAGVEVDILPATLPPRYRAHAFVSIHADGDEAGVLRGYKLARATFSATPEADDRLVASLYQFYGEATGLPRDDLHITRRMTAYYAFNSRRYCHAIAPGVPGAILEAGFLTNQADRQLLIGSPHAAARGIAQGVLRYLGLTS
jgi:hypothetical protein